MEELLKDFGNKQECKNQMVKAHLDHGYMLMEIAQFFGIHYTTVSKGIKKLLAKYDISRLYPSPR